MNDESPARKSPHHLRPRLIRPPSSPHAGYLTVLPPTFLTRDPTPVMLPTDQLARHTPFPAFPGLLVDADPSVLCGDERL